MDLESRTCFNTDWLAELAAGNPPPWAPGQREDDIAMDRSATDPDRTWCMSEVDIFADLNQQEWTPWPRQRR
jgi:hypothetical protein